MLWKNLGSNDFDDAVKKSNGVCILPVGCVEKHGPHMPLGTDVIIAESITEKAAEAEPAVVFPAMYFGEKTGAGEYPGTIIFSLDLRLRILQETCREIARNGFKKILICSFHGGNGAFIGAFTRSVLYDKDINYMVYSMAPDDDFPSPEHLLKEDYDFLTDEDKRVLRDFVDKNKKLGHACYAEVGLVYDVDPTLLRLDKMSDEDGLSTHRFDKFGEMGISTNFAWMGNYPNSYSGEYHEGMNERIAYGMRKFYVDRLANVIKFLKEETISDEYFEEWKAKQR